jgi:putative ATP-dependent endonuclease of OLD family
MNNIIIDKIRIAGFRGIKNLEMSLSRVAVLIGANNSGKTSILKALQLSMGDYSRYLSEEDFYIGPDEKRVNEILIDVRIVPIGKYEKRVQKFGDDWTNEFGDKIQAEANRNQFVAIRTRIKPNEIKGGFDIARYVLEKWPDFNAWETNRIKETRMPARLLSMGFISIEAQRDIHQELREKYSFVGKVLSNVEYKKDDITELEKLVKDINDEAVNKSEALRKFKTHLEKLNQSFQSEGSVEITPFPKKIRDLSKYFSVHFGETPNSTFSMEYHGMGTRSWASMLTAKAYIDLKSIKHEEEEKVFFPILATEEPEAHLHPNAQKTLYKQLAETEGQIIISTHSPYLAATANLNQLRYLKKTTNSNIEARKFSTELAPEEKRKLCREIIYSRGEILFSKAIVLCEGETEEQSLPLLFKKFFGHEAFVLGIDFVAVGGSGKKYFPFLSFAKDFCIPVFIFSDGEEKTIKDLKKQYDSVFGETDIMNSKNITILDNTDFEGYLISSGFKSNIETAIKLLDGETFIEEWIRKKHGTLKGRVRTSNPVCSTCKQLIYTDVLRDYKNYSGYEEALLDILKSAKPKYAPVIAEQLCYLDPKDFPPKITELFNKIKTGIKI